MKPKCEDCKYYEAVEGANLGDCHRFPQTQVVKQDNWCGEFDYADWDELVERNEES